MKYAVIYRGHVMRIVESDSIVSALEIANEIDPERESELIGVIQAENVEIIE